MSGQLCLKWNNHTNAFNKILSKIYYKDTYSDATLLCENKCYPVHRLVLSTCSDYFEEIFQQCLNINNKHPFIIIKEVRSEQLEALLNYMYKGEVNVPQEVLPDLIKAAEIFQIKGLAVPDEEENDSAPKASKKRSHSTSGSSNLSATPKKSRKQPSNKENSDEISDDNLEKDQDISEIYLTEQKQEIKCEPEDQPIEVIEDEVSQSSSMKNEEYQNYQEPETNFEDFNLEDSSHADFEPTQSTSWENSQEFTEKLPESNPSESMNAHFKHQFQNVEANETLKKESIHSCKYCSYKSYVKTNVRRHERKHTGERPYHCTFCDYKSSQKDNVEKHIRTHTGEKPYSCSQCDYKCVQKASLDRHILLYHIM